MGAPLPYALEAQVASGLAHLEVMVEVLESFAFSQAKGTSLVVKEQVGVVGLITPWDWPLNQIACKVAPALAADCTMVLKPPDISRNAIGLAVRLAAGRKLKPIPENTIYYPIKLEVTHDNLDSVLDGMKDKLDSYFLAEWFSEQQLDDFFV